MKQFAIIALGICLFTFVSCGDSNSELENSKHYTAEYLEESPGNTTTETFSYRDFENDMVLKSTKYTVSNTENQIETAPISLKRMTRYNLYLKENSATLSVDTICVGRYHNTYTVNATIYTFEPGTYKVENPNLDTGLSMWAEVLESEITCYYVENATNTKIRKEVYMYLINYTYTEESKSDYNKVDDVDITTSYKGTFSVTSNPEGRYTLSNNDYTFSFDETTRNLTMIQPRREYAIELDLAK